MGNRELYKETFSKLHASGTLDLEGIKMKAEKKSGFRCRRSLLAAMAVLILTIAMSTIAYAVTGGKIIDDVKVFIGGEDQKGTVVYEKDQVVVRQQDDNFRIKMIEEGDAEKGFAIYDKNSDEESQN